MLDSKEALEYLTELKKKYPNIKEISIDYNGSGDSFDEFYDFDFTDIDNNSIDEPSDWDLDHEFEEILWFALDKSGANFNDEGSRGTIIIYLTDLEVEVDNYFYVREEVCDGGTHIDFDEEKLLVTAANRPVIVKRRKFNKV